MCNDEIKARALRGVSPRVLWIALLILTAPGCEISRGLYRICLYIGKEVAKQAVGQTIHDLLDNWTFKKDDLGNVSRSDVRPNSDGKTGIYPGELQIEITHEFADGAPPVTRSFTFKNPTLIKDGTAGKWKLDGAIINIASNRS